MGYKPDGENPRLCSVTLYWFQVYLQELYSHCCVQCSYRLIHYPLPYFLAFPPSFIVFSIFPVIPNCSIHSWSKIHCVIPAISSGLLIIDSNDRSLAFFHTSALPMAQNWASHYHMPNILRQISTWTPGTICYGGLGDDKIMIEAEFDMFR